MILISGSKTVEATLNLFTSLLKMEMITAWRDAYEVVDINELLEDAKLLSLPIFSPYFYHGYLPCQA